ncbi:enterochelin esterase family protein [Cellulosimicrobium cellulans]|uniref:enterochelin esterase domain-containing protein n=1 Tax=Cellulosimicrobium cellulans TaxID=1710 RepID=UPI0019595466|nr:enterochelin esterase domain-containing protein [Cellulosimicrobium cellulans]MBM7820183.1 enterochelin esterase family protein [Cellulosimicrobium cellulans]
MPPHPDPEAPPGRPVARLRRTPPKVPRPEPAPRVVGPVVERLEAALAASPGRRDAVVERFWSEGAGASPVVETAGPGEAVATFLVRDGGARAVLLFVNRLTDERNLADSLMARVPGTDVWHLSYRMATTWRASYAVLAHRGDGPAPWDAPDQAALRRALDLVGRPDPRNPRTCRNRAGQVQSVVELPDAPPQPYVERRPGVARGAVTDQAAPGGRRAWVYEPPVPEGTATDVVLALDGDAWTGSQDLATTLDNLHHDGAVRPLRAVLLDAGSRERRWGELDGGGGMDAYLAHDLLDWARASLPVRSGRGAVSVAGQSLGALTSLRVLAAHPDRVGAAISQSASLWQGDPSAGLAPGALAGTRAWVEVGTQEWVLRPEHPAAVGRLRAAGCEVAYREFDGGHDDACWRGGIADALAWAHPPTR